jgi:hypothetical protein
MFKPADDLLKVHMQFAYRSCLFTLPSTTLFKVTSYQVVKDFCFMTLKTVEIICWEFHKQISIS